MTRLSKSDNNTLRGQEWRLLKACGPGSLPSTSLPSTSLLSLAVDQHQLSEKYQHDTFLIKTFFDATEKCYLILLTNFKQCWFEKLELEGIRKRSMNIKSFAHDEDSQLEALLLSISETFADVQAAKEGSADAASSPRQLHERNGKLDLTVGFNFGLATVQWDFNLSPLLASTSDHPLATEGAGGHHVPSTKGHTTDEDEDEEDLLSMLRGNRNSGKGKQSLKRGRHLLEDDDEVEKDLETGPFKGVDGMSVLFDHVILPLISLTNVYRKQVKAQEAVIKAKENEVYEALEILELSGINHRNRRRATEPYQKGAAETKVQSDIELLVRPQLHGPKELFGEKTTAHLCSIVTKNAAEAQGRSSITATLLDRDTLSNDVGQPSLIADGPGPGSADAATLLITGDSATIHLSAAVNLEDADTTDGNRKLTKLEEEEENRRILWEKLDKERAEKARAGKKKRLF